MPQGLTLGPPFFPYSPLMTFKKPCKAYHFTDNTSLTFSNKCLKTLAIKINPDLRNILHWLRANKLSLNVQKIELIMVHSKKKKPTEDITQNVMGKNLYQQVQLNNFLLIFSI